MRNRFWLFAAIIVCAIVTLLVFGPRPAPVFAQDDAEIIAPEDTATCLGCHEDRVDMGKLSASAHGKVNCQQCHQGVNQYPHPEAAIAKKPACATCHKDLNKALSGSVHGHTISKNAPNCHTCHPGSSHEIAKVTNLSANAKEGSCRRCHADAVTALTGGRHGGAGKAHADLSCLACHGKTPHTVKGFAGKGAANCQQCHSDNARMLAASAHGQAGTSISCESCHGAVTHNVDTPKKLSPEQAATRCESCHAKQAEAVANGAHSGGMAGSKLNCTSCHGTNLHAVKKPKTETAVQKNANCQACHTDISHSFAMSAHGKLGDKGPQCITCHGQTVHTVKPVKAMAQPRDASCRQCHSDATEMLTKSVHGQAGGKPADCLTCHGGSPHTVLSKARMTEKTENQDCASCHKEEGQAYLGSVHSRRDKQPGDHPTCRSCHGDSVHSITAPKKLTRQDAVTLCAKCHDNRAMMLRYGVSTEAVSSYRSSFHGKALTHFNKQEAAACVDCHGLHGVMSPDNVKSPTGKAHVAETCRKCHPGAQANFAMSGANHLGMRIDRSLFLRTFQLLFTLLVVCSMLGLTGMVALDLRRKVFCKRTKPHNGRFVAFFIGVSFLALIGGLGMAYMKMPGVGWAWITAAALMGIAFIGYFVRRKRYPELHRTEKQYPRLNKVLRLQHILLASSFIVLAMTGLPMRFAHVNWVGGLLAIWGGLDSARIIHRVAGVVMVSNWFFHLGYLMYLWRKANYSLQSWTMFPTKKDFIDFFDTVKWGFGISHQPARFDRFQFREKFDYFADMWGTIVLGLSGIILWLPVTVGNQLPDVAFGAAYIAHSYEAMLAVMAIVVWHFYNTHFNPDTFPMNATWYTGTMPESEMAREHPVEKARMDGEE